jgi:hypothetical protein
MPKVQVVSQIDIDLNEVLDGVAHLNTSELEAFVQQVNVLLARRKAPSLPKREAELLQQINQGLPSAVRQRYQELNRKLEAEVLTAAEHQELLNLIDKIEQADATRLRQLIELAQLREMSIDDLMQQLNILPPVHV